MAELTDKMKSWLLPGVGMVGAMAYAMLAMGKRKDKKDLPDITKYSERDLAWQAIRVAEKVSKKSSQLLDTVDLMIQTGIELEDAKFTVTRLQAEIQRRVDAEVEAESKARAAQVEAEHEVEASKARAAKLGLAITLEPFDGGFRAVATHPSVVESIYADGTTPYGALTQLGKLLKQEGTAPLRKKLGIDE